MRRLVLYLIILVISIWIGVKIAQDPGYVMLAYRHTTIEMPLWAALVILFFMFLVFYVALRMWRGVFRVPYFWRARTSRRNQEILQKLTSKGLLDLSAGNWNLAKKNLAKAGSYAPAPWIYYVGAAYAADQLKNLTERDSYLQKASSSSVDAKIAVGLLQAQFLYNQQPMQTLALLEHLRQVAPRQPYVLRLLAKTYEHLDDWNNLFTLLPAIRKQKVFSPNELERLEVIVYRGLLYSAEYNDADVITKVWKKIPKALQQNPVLLNSYAQLLLAKGANNEAEELLREYIPKTWDDKLLKLYGNILSSKPDQQLMAAEKWLITHKRDATLLYLLGVLSVRNQLWGKARGYLEASLAVEPRAETYLELGRLLERLDENQTAIMKFYKAGLKLKNHNSSSADCPSKTVNLATVN